MPHKVSPLSLLAYRFHVFECEATESESTQGGLSLFTEQTMTCESEDSSQWHVELIVKFEPEHPENPSMYRGLIKISGEFEVHESFSEKNREALIRVTATSMLYGACREMLANFTARSTHGILSLPSISFRKKKREEESTEEQESLPD